MLVAAGSGLVTLGEPSSAGVPARFTELTRVLPLDDEAAAEQLFATEGDAVAAVVIEPVPANNGLLIQRKAFLEKLRALSTRHGALLIFDEVISGFRLGLGGAAEYYDLQPDLATFGKVIGGGMPVGAFAGPRDLMKHLSPEGGVYQAGTLSGNPVAMTAGLATLSILQAENGWARLAALGDALEARLAPVLEAAPIEIRLARVGSMFWLALHASELPRAAETIDRRSGETYARIFGALLERGIALAPSAYEVGFLSLAHTEADIDRLAQALGAALANIE